MYVCMYVCMYMYVCNWEPECSASNVSLNCGPQFQILKREKQIQYELIGGCKIGSSKELQYLLVYKSTF